MNDSAHVLIAEDDDGHATLIRRNLKRSGLANAAVRLRDGQELLDFLYRQGGFAQRQPLSAVAIVVDLNMPRLGGFDVLARLKKDRSWARIPIVVLSTTDNPLDIDRSYELGASAYLTKPLDDGMFGDVLRRMTDFLAAVRLPGEKRLTLGPHVL